MRTLRPRLDRRSAAVRGSPGRRTNHLEALERSYVGAIAAAAGCSVSVPEIDEGVDLELTHRSDSHAVRDHVARLEIQLKATTSARNVRQEHVSAQLEKDRFDYLATPDPSINKVVVIMAVPDHQAHWVFSREKALSIHHCAYWVNLAGRPPATTKTVTVRAPRSQVFDDLTLCEMMVRIGMEGTP